MTFEVLASLMLVAFFVLLLIGIPVGLTLAATGFIFGYLGFGIQLFNLLPHRVFGVVTNYTLLAIPLFVFMGVMLEKSKLAEELMDVIGLAAGSLKGGLGIGIILVGVLMGATTGIVGATVVTLGLLTLPGMLRRGYERGLACGIICASGTLGQIIPPSLILDSARRHHQPIGRHAVCRRHGPGADAFGALHHLHPGARRYPARHGAGNSESRACRDFRRAACRKIAARGGAADRPGDPGAWLDHSRHRRAVGGSRHGRARLDIGCRHRPASVGAGAARDGAGHHPHHRNGDVHSDLRAGVLAGVPRAARRKAGSGRLHADPGRHQCQHLVPDGADLRARLLHRMDRDLLHRGAAVPADLHQRQYRPGVAGNADLREPADVVPDAAVRLVAVLSARRGAAGDHHQRHLSRSSCRSSLCR